MTLCFEVADTGIGISDTDIHKLFSNFTRLDESRNQNVEGTGLGLAITKRLCAEMGGDIAVTSEYGKGSVFTVHVPQEYFRGAELATVKNPGSKRTLLYDERPLYAESVSAALEKLDVPVTRTESPEHFLRELETGRCPFAFISAGMLEQASGAVRRLRLTTRLTVLAAPEETSSFEGVPALLMPAYTVPVANLLNGQPENQTGKRAPVKFIAPDVRVLIVDDIKTNLKVVQGLLLVYRMQIDICDNGEASVEMVRTRRYDLVFMDHMMPGVDGIEATARIRALEGDYFKKVPIIALTANALSGMQEMFLSKGFDDYLAKPIEIAKLNAVIDKWVPREKRLRPDGSPFYAREPAEEGPPPAAAEEGPQSEPVTLRSIEGLDAEKGIAMCGGMEAVYTDILAEYCRDIEKRLPFLRETHKRFAGIPGGGASLQPADSPEIRDFVIEVHALKSASASIGAEDLSKKALLLENAGKEGNLELIAAHLEDFIGNLFDLANRIQAFLRQEENTGT